jgi:4a-hydroxytetrahydrobiopterin dehydratase
MDSESKLSKKTCVACTAGMPPLKGDQLAQLAKQLGNEWKVINEHHLEKMYRFANFVEALSFTNLVGEVAEREGHHPDIYLSYGKVRIQLWTHKIDGLSESDFVLAAKCDELL